MVRRERLENFVAIDLETTGLDAEKDEILEVGAVKVRDGEISERFASLVSPSRPIPPAITRLTGISDADCAGQPPLTSILPEFCVFLGDDPIVAHNVPFDVAFLNRQSKVLERGTLEREFFDTLILSRILLPRLKNHQLQTLLSYFRISSASSHRAESDAESVAKLFLALMEYTGQFDLDTLQTLLRLTPQTSPLRRFLSRGVQRAPMKKRGGQRRGDNFVLNLVNSEGEGGRKRRKEPINLDIRTIENVFGAEGDLSRVMRHYERRPQQIQMARHVTNAFNNSDILLAEAGTGIGKTMAYLVPALFWAVENGERIILSTKTKNLQEQLFYSDLPLLRSALNNPFQSVLLKGRSNYLCLNKWYRTVAESDLTAEERMQILPLVTWMKETVSGDISENTGFKLHQNSGLWNKVCAESSSCLGQNCKYKDRCFYQKVRSAAQRAHIVVTNHALLFSDVLMDHAVLDTYSCLVLDEAHTVERVAVQHFGCDFTLWKVRSLLQRLHVRERRENIELGLLISLLRRIERAAITPIVKETLSKRLKKAIERVEQVHDASKEFFPDLRYELSKKERGERRPYRSKVRYDINDRLFSLESSVLFLNALKRLGGELSRIYHGLSELPKDSFHNQTELGQAVNGLAQESQELLSDVSSLLAADNGRDVYWAELPSQNDDSDVRLYAAPLEVGEKMNVHFYNNLRTLIFTSGTLTVNGRFDYVMERLGLDQERTVQLITDSPFDFDSQTLICVPSFLTSPKDRTFRSEIGQFIEQVILATRRGTLALFTSYEMLMSTYADIRDELEKEGIPVFAQGVDGSRSRIMAQFKEERNSVLLGTESFWEGVDVPGQALEVLFLTKLPFAVPTEPFVQAQMEDLQGRGLDPFQHFSLPEALMKFRQGFGRLIRSREDRGIVILCDGRVLTSRYGHLFLKALPAQARVYPDRENLLTEIKQWLDLNSK